MTRDAGPPRAAGPRGPAARRKGPPPAAHVRLVRLLAWNYLMEVGAEVIYRIQARIVRDRACREVFHRLGREEAEHTERLLALWDAPMRVLRVLGWVCRAGAVPLGLASGIAGCRASLRMDRELERRGIVLYEASLESLLSLGARPGAARTLRAARDAARDHLASLERLLPGA